MVSAALTERSSLEKRDFRLLKVIRKLELFNRLNLEEAQKVLALCQRRNFAAGELVWQAHRASTDMLLLMSGRLEVTDPQGQKLGEILPGGSVGEMGSITGHPRFVGVRALEPSTALSLNRGRFARLAQNEPGIYAKILEDAVDALAHRLTRTEHDHFRGNMASVRTAGRW